jgi:hypothetical protein
MTDFYKIEINGQQFESAYLVYIVKLTSANYGQYFYIGQTGDRHYLSARPAFRRLAGHMSDKGSSTENQIYRQIVSKILGIERATEKGKFDNRTKEEVSAFLTKCKMEMYAYPITDFTFDISFENHKLNRQLTEKIENELISYFTINIGEERILNKKMPKNQTNCFDPLTLNIIKHIIQISMINQILPDEKYAAICKKMQAVVEKLENNLQMPEDEFLKTLKEYGDFGKELEEYVGKRSKA